MTGKNKASSNEKNERAKRHEMIIKAVKTNTMKSQQNIVDALESYKIFTAQGTVSDDLKYLKISKGEDNFYKITDTTLQKMHIDEIQSLMEENSPICYDNVKFHYMKIEKGNASLYAFHFKKAFPDIILEVTIKEEGLLMLVDKDKVPQGFFELLENQ